MPTQTLLPHPVSTGQLIDAEGRTLPLRNTRLIVTAGGGLARTRLVQRFANPHDEPLTVTYQLPLPADGGVAAFAFTIGDRRVEGEIEGRQAARERFEQALEEGHSAALLEQDRTALFEQTIGNIPPGAEVIAELTVDQPLLWIGAGQWEYRFPTTVAPRYLGTAGRVPDAGRVVVDVAAAPLPPRLELELRIGDRLVHDSVPTSPSHLLAHGDDVGITLQAEGAVRLDRDLAVRWQVGTAEVGTDLITARPDSAAPHGDAAYGLLTLVPPTAPARALARDLTVLLDTSGSMHGEPLQQAKQVIARLLEGLTDQDQLQLIEFSMQPRRWQKAPVRATAERRQQALHWLSDLEAGGCTEMHSAVLESLRSLRDDAQSQVLLVTDGLIGFEREIMQALLHRMPRNCRFHTLGVGSAANRSLTYGAARAGRGVEVIVGLGEDPAAAARRIDASMRAPVVVNLELTGTALLGTAPERLPDLFASEPTRLSLRLRPEGGTLEVRGTTANGPFTREVVVAATAFAAGRAEVVTRCGRELVEDLEMKAAAGDENEHDQQIEQLGLRFGLATRLTSWIAVSSEPTVDPKAPIRRERVPHELPHGMSAEGLGLRSPTQDWINDPLGSIVMQSAKCVDFDIDESSLVGEPAPPRSSRPRSLFDDLAGPADAESAPPPTGQPLPPPIAMLIRQRPESLVLELPGNGEDWTLPKEVELHWSDGSVHRARVDAAHSTRSGTVPVGARIRLTLLLPSDAPTTPPMVLGLNGDEIAIALAP